VDRAEGLFVCEWLEVREGGRKGGKEEARERGGEVNLLGSFSLFPAINPPDLINLNPSLLPSLPPSLQAYSSLADSLAQGDVVSRTIAPSLARMIARYTAASYHPTVDPPPYYGKEVGGEEEREEWMEGDGGKKWDSSPSSSGKQHQQNEDITTAAARTAAAAVRQTAAAAPHASTHPNQGHIDFWSKCVFPPLLAALPSSSSSSSSLPPSLPPSLTKPHLFPLLEALNREGDLQRAVCRLWGSYRERKESLVHADLHCKNILVRPLILPPSLSPSLPPSLSLLLRTLECLSPTTPLFFPPSLPPPQVRSTLSLKVVDCEKYMSGPAGLDLGQFSANYVWYIATFAVGADRYATSSSLPSSLPPSFPPSLRPSFLPFGTLGLYFILKNI